jgi:signal transduction histidine kinase
MLKLSRLENGTTELKVERTDVVYLVKSLVSSQHQLFHEKGLHLRFKDDTAHGECQADVDPDLIREAVVNLMSNAMRYTDEDGWVVVSVGSTTRTPSSRCVIRALALPRRTSRRPSRASGALT